jgi:hypothetical protein
MPCENKENQTKPKKKKMKMKVKSIKSIYKTDTDREGGGAVLMFTFHLNV